MQVPTLQCLTIELNNSKQPEMSFERSDKYFIRFIIDEKAIFANLLATMCWDGTIKIQYIFSNFAQSSVNLSLD